MDINLSTEEAVAQGYLIIKRQGLITSYIPTAKYKAVFRPLKSNVTMESHMGLFHMGLFHVEEVVFDLCGECGEPDPDCWCPSVTVTPEPSVIKELSP
jgi:hypothetical protein